MVCRWKAGYEVERRNQNYSREPFVVQGPTSSKRIDGTCRITAWRTNFLSQRSRCSFPANYQVGCLYDVELMLSRWFGKQDNKWREASLQVYSLLDKRYFFSIFFPPTNGCYKSCFMTKGFLRQEENQYLALPHGIIKKMPVHIQQLIGYKLSQPYCGLGG